jgi:hypothetical protein
LSDLLRFEEQRRQQIAGRVRNREEDKISEKLRSRTPTSMDRDSRLATEGRTNKTEQEGPP